MTLTLYDADGNVLDRAEGVQDPEADRCGPVERLAPTLLEDEWTWLQVRRVRGDGQVRWNRPVPDVWLRMDQLEACS